MTYVRTALFSVAIALTVCGCFNPELGVSDTEAGSASDTGRTSALTAANPSSTAATTVSADTTNGDVDTGDPGCRVDGDCAPMADECEVATCNGGTCDVANAAAGAACGDRTATECNGADTCDGDGACVDNQTEDGLDCAECPSGQCLCSSGTCGECVVYADSNLFTTERSLRGWELTGSWGLYTEAPMNQLGEPAIPFGNQVLGTDGNRREPYPGLHAERSYARTPPTELPPSITFQSWHIDEGSGTYDNKSIRISTDDGVTWTEIISCVLNPVLAFCPGVNTRAADDWDSITLALPAPLIGQVGIIEFAYDTRDACCEFERGWFIDVTNFATECTCASDDVCARYGGDCGEGVCGTNGGCSLGMVVAGTACDDPTDDTCTTPDTCDGFGYCSPNNNANALLCDECQAGEDCATCASGTCLDCDNLPDPNTFDFPPVGGQPLSGWVSNAVSGGAWTVFGNIPNNEQNAPALIPSSAPMLGIDGSTVAPYDGVGEISTANIVSRPDLVPDAITFRSWHQDQGGASLDLKNIDLSVDEGQTWLPLADCAAGGPLSAFPFCANVDNRDPEDWDDISLDTAMWGGMFGQIRFSYDTVTACCGFERGWYIDDLNFAQTCNTPDLSQNLPPCQFLAQELCEAELFCGWDPGLSQCIDCTTFGVDEASCTANPACEFFNYPNQGVCNGVQGN